MLSLKVPSGMTSKKPAPASDIPNQKRMFVALLDATAKRDVETGYIDIPTAHSRFRRIMGNTSSASASSAISDKLLGSLLRATACEIDEEIHLVDHDLDVPESCHCGFCKPITRFWVHPF